MNGGPARFKRRDAQESHILSGLLSGPREREGVVQIQITVIQGHHSSREGLLSILSQFLQIFIWREFLEYHLLLITSLKI